MRKQILLMIVVTGAALLGVTLKAKALRVAAPNAPQRTMQADIVVLGEVMAVEEATVDAERYPNNPQKVPYQIANVRITKRFKGAQGLTNLRVGFIPKPKVKPQPVPEPGQPGVVIRPPRRPDPFLVNLEKGKKGCFFLQKHHSADFYVFAQLCVPIFSDQKNYKTEVARVEKTLKVLDDPMKYLKSSDRQEQTFAAAVLLTRYQTFPVKPGQPNPRPQEEPVSQEETRLILDIVINQDWTAKFDPNKQITSPMGLFYMLRLQPKHGWTPPRVQRGQNPLEVIEKAAKEWYRSHGKDFRLTRFVSE